MKSASGPAAVPRSLTEFTESGDHAPPSWGEGLPPPTGTHSQPCPLLPAPHPRSRSSTLPPPTCYLQSVLPAPSCPPHPRSWSSRVPAPYPVPTASPAGSFLPSPSPSPGPPGFPPLTQSPQPALPLPSCPPRHLTPALGPGPQLLFLIHHCERRVWLVSVACVQMPFSLLHRRLPPQTSVVAVTHEPFPRDAGTAGAPRLCAPHGCRCCRSPQVLGLLGFLVGLQEESRRPGSHGWRCGQPGLPSRPRA